MENKILIGGYIELPAKTNIDVNYFITAINKLYAVLRKREMVTGFTYGINVMEICGFVKEDSTTDKIFQEQLQIGRMVARDITNKLGEFGIAIISPDTAKHERERNFIIPKEDVIQRWQFTTQIELSKEFQHLSFETFFLGDIKTDKPLYRIFYNEGELCKNYGIDFWHFIDENFIKLFPTTEISLSKEPEDNKQVLVQPNEDNAPEGFKKAEHWKNDWSY
jgi:hypothetical protein